MIPPMKKELHKLKKHYGSWLAVARALGVTDRTIRNQMNSAKYTGGFKALVKLELMKISKP